MLFSTTPSHNHESSSASKKDVFNECLPLSESNRALPVGNDLFSISIVAPLPSDKQLTSEKNFVVQDLDTSTASVGPYREFTVSMDLSKSSIGMIY